MIARADQLAALTPARRAEVIFAEAQSQLSNRLWKAALGDSDRKDGRDASPLGGNNLDLGGLIGLLGNGDAPATNGVAGHCGCQCACACHRAPTQASAEHFDAGGEAPERRAARRPVELAAAPAGAVRSASVSLGVNARYNATLAAAESRTGIPAKALAAIIDAEAAKTSDGSWNTHSRNPRSSAAGLGQFLSGTWQTLAQTPGSWLNSYATERGWLDGRGKVQAGARAELLALRYDASASILGVADLAKQNLDHLEKAGIRVRTDDETLAKAAYLGHHLGLGDARKFLAGGIEAGRARMLLTAQIGGAAAEQRIASAGDATAAHRQWLLQFIERRIRPDNFAA